MNIAWNLCQQIHQLHKKAGQLNLYVTRCNEKNKVETARLKHAIKCIKLLIMDIENQMNNL